MCATHQLVRVFFGHSFDLGFQLCDAGVLAAQRIRCNRDDAGFCSSYGNAMLTLIFSKATVPGLCVVCHGLSFVVESAAYRRYPPSQTVLPIRSSGLIQRHQFAASSSI